MMPMTLTCRRRKGHPPGGVLLARMARSYCSDGLLVLLTWLALIALMNNFTNPHMQTAGGLSRETCCSHQGACRSWCARATCSVQQGCVTWTPSCWRLLMVLTVTGEVSYSSISILAATSIHV